MTNKREQRNIQKRIFFFLLSYQVKEKRISQLDHPASAMGFLNKKFSFSSAERTNVKIGKWRWKKKVNYGSHSLSERSVPDGGREFPFSFMLTVSSLREMQPPMMIEIGYPTRHRMSCSIYCNVIQTMGKKYFSTDFRNEKNVRLSAGFYFTFLWAYRLIIGKTSYHLYGTGPALDSFAFICLNIAVVFLIEIN